MLRNKIFKKIIFFSEFSVDEHCATVSKRGAAISRKFRLASHQTLHVEQSFAIPSNLQSRSSGTRCAAFFPLRLRKFRSFLRGAVSRYQKWTRFFPHATSVYGLFSPRLLLPLTVCFHVYRRTAQDKSVNDRTMLILYRVYCQSPQRRTR